MESSMFSAKPLLHSALDRVRCPAGVCPRAPPFLPLHQQHIKPHHSTNNALYEDDTAIYYLLCRGIKDNGGD